MRLLEGKERIVRAQGYSTRRAAIHPVQLDAWPGTEQAVQPASPAKPEAEHR
jgi:hypothetical protein